MLERAYAVHFGHQASRIKKLTVVAKLHPVIWVIRQHKAIIEKQDVIAQRPIIQEHVLPFIQIFFCYYLATCSSSLISFNMKRSLLVRASKLPDQSLQKVDRMRWRG
jgi:hypothetical protein